MDDRIQRYEAMIRGEIPIHYPRAHAIIPGFDAYREAVLRCLAEIDPEFPAERVDDDKLRAMHRTRYTPLVAAGQLRIRPLEIAAATAELRQRLGEIQEAVRRLEEAKIVSQETM